MSEEMGGERMAMAQTGPAAVRRSLLAAVDSARGHFRYESGHHGDLWLDLDTLFVDAREARRWATALAQEAATRDPQVICGPLTGGAFVAQEMAAELGAGFVFVERFPGPAGAVAYRVPASLRPRLRGRRVIVVDDVVNAGSALLATVAELRTCEAELVGFASLLVLGEALTRTTQQFGVPFFRLATLQRSLWAPEACPLCRAGEPLEDRLVTHPPSRLLSDVV
jgi:orotate phosphoribosyltransferase